jgi:hypothetical protein
MLRVVSFPCIFLVVFFIVLIKGFTEENATVTSIFEPLIENEQFAYKMAGDNHRTLQLFARNKQFPKLHRFINEWENVEQWSGLQFSRDRKACFLRNRSPV